MANDHEILVMRIKLRLRKKPRKEVRRKLAVEKLKVDEVRERFEVKTNMFEILQDKEVEEIEDFWREHKDVLKEVGEEVLGFEKLRKEEWISGKLLERMEEKNKAKIVMNSEVLLEDRQRAKEEYNEKDIKVKRSVREVKRNYLDRLATEAEEAALRNNTRKLYQISKSLENKGKQLGGSPPVKDRDGKMLATEEEQMWRWSDHFHEVLNTKEPQNSPRFQVAEILLIDTDPPRVDEVLQAINNMKNNKVRGSGGILAELFRLDPQVNAESFGSFSAKNGKRKKYLKSGSRDY
jgi:DNA polymerase III alpha subunit (gram-positive type)